MVLARLIENTYDNGCSRHEAQTKKSIGPPVLVMMHDILPNQSNEKKD